MDTENLAPLANKKSEMKEMCGVETVKIICLKDYNRWDWNGTSPHYIPKHVGVMVSDLEQK